MFSVDWNFAFERKNGRVATNTERKTIARELYMEYQRVRYILYLLYSVFLLFFILHLFDGLSSIIYLFIYFLFITFIFCYFFRYLHIKLIVGLHLRLINSVYLKLIYLFHFVSHFFLPLLTLPYFLTNLLFFIPSSLFLFLISIEIIKIKR